MVSNTLASPEPSSFRDPSGTVFHQQGELFRQINPCYQEQYDFLMSSGLYDKLIERKLLIAHVESGGAGIDGHAYKIIKPALIPLITYPYEWCFGQLKDAALTTLRIHRLALEHSMILKDASAYNIQFVRGNAVHIDTLSFDFYKEGEPWVAYGQFCRHFIAPLFLMAYTDIRLSQLLRAYIDGIPLDLASRLLAGKGGFGARAHIHMHANAVLKHGQEGHSTLKSKKLSISRLQMTALIDSMISLIEKLCLNKIQTEWGDYYVRTNYSNSAINSKKIIVAEYVSKISPAVTWDFGANDGTFSRLALSGEDSFVAAFDVDPIAVERNYTAVRRSCENMLPLLLDLTNPSPSIGFANQERGSLETRQRPDCILMLAVIHHLAISNNLPLDIIAEWLASICSNLIIEFVPKSDSQVQILLATRDDIFPNYTEAGFENAFSEFFKIVEKRSVDESKRVLYLMKKT